MQPPPGYPQPGQPPQYPQGGQPQYAQGQHGMSPMPYYPQKKKGMPGWAWGLIIGAIVLFCGFPLLAILMIPLITSNTRDARRAEGEQLLGSGRDMARIEYSKKGAAPVSFSRFEMPIQPSMLTGKYYRVDDAIHAKPGGSAEITCTPQQTMSDGTGRLEFVWSHGMGQIRWDN